MKNNSTGPSADTELRIGYLLLVEDEPQVQENNRKLLQRHGYSIKQAYSLKQAREVMALEPPLAVVLDIQLPDGSGIDFLRDLRRTSNVPVLLLTAMGTPQDIIRGLEAGGDDYLAKPYDLSVFLMRVEALLRRAAIVPDTIALGPLKLDPASGKAFLAGKDMVLSQKEYALLLQFAQHPGKMLGAGYLYEKVWGRKLIDEDNSLKVAISKLRTKLIGSGYTITASRREGYYFEKL